MKRPLYMILANTLKWGGGEEKGRSENGA